jgi:hypothetical protein
MRSLTIGLLFAWSLVQMPACTSVVRRVTLGRDCRCLGGFMFGLSSVVQFAVKVQVSE